MTYLGMQVLIEGLALAAFATDPRPGDRTRSPRSVNAYVMQDEARHVAFGRLALRDYYPQLTRGGARRARGVRASRPATCMRDRFLAEEVWETLGLPVDECAARRPVGVAAHLPLGLFSRIVPTIKDIGLWGPRIRKALRGHGHPRLRRRRRRPRWPKTSESPRSSTRRFAHVKDVANVA